MKNILSTSEEIDQGYCVYALKRLDGSEDLKYSNKLSKAATIRLGEIK